jgi:hypothetical protein
MKDLDEMVAGGMVKMHDYKGFTVEPVLGGYNIILYGRKHIMYVAGPAGLYLTEDMRKARAFRSANFCHGFIDELLEDHRGWVQSMGGMSVSTVADLEAVQYLRRTAIKQQIEPKLLTNGAESLADHECKWSK